MGLFRRAAYVSLLKVPYLRDKIHGISIQRAHEMVDWFVDSISNGEKVLDIGCGFGDISKILIERRQCRCTLVDIDFLSLNDELEVILCDGRKLFFKDKQFETVLLVDVLHHCPNPEQILSEAARVSCGKIIVIEDVYNNDWEKKRTIMFDSIINLEFLGHPHQNKPVSEWNRLFQEMDLRVVHQKEIAVKFLIFPVRQAVFTLECKS